MGGSETSGQQVLGPRRRDKRAGGGSKVGDMVGDMFRSAREHGAEVVEPGPSSSSKRRAAFKGTGYRLGQNENDTTGRDFFSWMVFISSERLVRRISWDYV